MRPLGELVGDIVPPAGTYPCRGHGCSATIERPGICAACGAEYDRREHNTSLQTAFRTIPERYRWATIVSVAAAEHRGRVKMPQQYLDAAERLVRHRTLMLVGASGVGKTSLACAVLRSIIEAGRHGATTCDYDRARRARFYRARDLWTPAEVRERDDVPAYVLAMRMPVVVLDDVGQEAGREEGGFSAAERLKLMADILSARHDDTRLQTIVTTFARRDEWVRLYGDGVARRYFDRKDVQLLDMDAMARRAS